MECLICTGKTIHFVEEKSGIHYHRCQTCGVIFKDPVYYQTLEEQKRRYDLHTNDERDEGYRAYFQRFLDFVMPKVERVGTALDFGCGRSRLLANILNDMNIDADAYDPLYHPDTEYHSKKYDLIVSTEVFEHLHDPKALFSELLTLLNPGGYVALQTQFYPEDPKDFSQWYYHKDPTHIVFFSPITFRVLAEICGCDYLADNGKNMVIFQKR